ncbi:carbohydrate kinase family protein [Deinococcus sp. SL84]|uniref:carbohydrate kinase family protein n=1 Tax=Deinococcus sp. SL84 TaxID=2994663 RepID=UPI00227574C1|nr:carbohydrate kinase [Deinococcus sp. SL84]MCY1702221.1 carbohydrate kinase [Deinococcus sp. SL84]
MIYAIGEALIDFVPQPNGDFSPQVGGAPLNVAAAVARLGGQSSLITQLGADAFGGQIVRAAQAAGVDTAHIRRTDAAKTGLAFVTLQPDGERSFSFYRDPSADMLYAPEQLSVQPRAGDWLHFCSVSLLPSPMREAHAEAIQRFREAGGHISFDLNIRLPLWADPNECRAAVWDFLPSAHLVKVSDDELPFVSERGELSDLFVGDVQHVLYTKGRHGAEWHTHAGKLAEVPAFPVQAVDATGAGDAFTGAVLRQWQELGSAEPDAETAAGMLRRAAAVGALTILKRGALAALPDESQLQGFLAKEQP